MFDSATGFSPCGTPMGAIREYNAYSAPCQTFLDGPQSNRIRWYFVPDDRPFFEGMHCFHPRVDDMFDPSGGEYEKAGLRPCPRRHYSGVDYWQKPGDHVHGDEEDFLGRATIGKYQQDNGTFPDPCDEMIFLIEGIQLSCRCPADVVEKFIEGLRPGELLVEEDTITLTMLEGLSLGDVLVIDPVESFAAGLQLGDVLVEVEEPVEVLVEGLNFAGYLPGEEIEGLGDWMALGDVIIGVPPTDDEPEIVGAGLQLGDVQLDVEETVEVSAQGLQLGDVVVALFPAVEVAPQGLQLGSPLIDVGVPPATPTEILTEGLKLGDVLIDVVETMPEGVELNNYEPEEEEEVIPGSACADAGEVAMGVEYTFDKSAAVHHWFKFPVTNGVTYHVKKITNAGSYHSVTVHTGASCSGLNMEFGLHMASTCNTFNKGSDTWCFIDVAMGLIGDDNYTIIADVGACP